MPVRKTLATAVLLLCVVSGAPGQDAGELPVAQRRALERLALARARTAMYRTIVALPLKDETNVGAWASRTPARDRGLRLWVRTRPRAGLPRFFTDGSCDSDMRVAPSALAGYLSQLSVRDPDPADISVSTSDILQAARGWGELWTTGYAAVHERADRKPPTGWEDIRFEGAELARQAAAADAIHALLDEAGQMKVTVARRLHEFLHASEAVYDAVRDAVAASATVTVEAAADQLAVARAEIGVPELIRILTRVHQDAYRGDVFHAADFREMALNARLETISAEGVAPPPERYRIQPEYELIELDRPKWADDTLTATGIYEPADAEEFSGDLRGELARFNAVDALRRKALALVVQKNVTVEEVIEFSPELKPDVVTFLGGARLVDSRADAANDTLAVRVELPLERLWKIVRRAMERVEVDPPEPPATTQPSAAPAEDDQP